MSKFTRGPWLLDEYGNLCTNVKDSRNTRVKFSGVTLTTGEEAAANTALAGDAPALLDALENLLKLLKPAQEFHAHASAARALIAKHRGGV